MATPPPPDQDTTLAMIAEHANVLKSAGQPPLFDVNVSRRNAAGVPQQLASFTNATLEHINNPLRWLPQLCGGGEYILNVRHPDKQDRIGGPIGVNFDKTTPGMEPKAVDPRVARAPNWQGPTLVGGAYPEPTTPSPQYAGATAMPWGQQAPQVTTGYGLPTTPTAPPDRERELAAQLADTKAALARIEAESKMRIELENERRASEQRVREAENRAREAEQRTQQQIAELRAAAAAPKPDPAAGWKELITVIMPLVQQMLTSQHDMRVMMLKMSEEQNRRQIEAAEKQHQAQMEMIRAITAQKPGMSDEMKLLIETLRNDANKGDKGSEAMVAMVSKQLEAMGMMNKMSLDMINTVADIQMGDSEHPVVGAIREAAMAMKTMMSGAKEGAQRIIPKKPQLPQGQQQLTPPQIAAIQAQQRARAAQAAAAAQAGRAVPQKPPAPQAQPQPPPQPAPVPVVNFSEQPTPAAAPVQTMETPAGAAVTHFDVLKAGIEAGKPAAEVVDYFVQLKKAEEPSLKAALDAHGGSPWELLKAEFGMGFISKHMAYFEELGETIDARGVEEGWWPADDGEDEPGEDEDGEAEAEAAAPEIEGVPTIVTEPVTIEVPAPTKT